MVALAYYHKKLYDTAELVLDDLYKRSTAQGNAHVNYVYGLVYDITNRPDRAKLAYEKAVGIDPNHASALVNLGVHQLKNGQYNQAQQTFERLTREFRRADAITLTSLGSAYRGRSADYQAGSGDRDNLVRSAEQQYKKALQANSSYGPAYYNLGLLYMDNDPYPGVADAIARLNAAKSYFEQYKNMSGVDMKLFDERMKDITKAIKKAEKKAKAAAKAKKNS
jgi:tetratricopeptide (TPR) repeat protein